MPQRQCSKTKSKTTSVCRRVNLPIDRQGYAESLLDKHRFREMLDDHIERYPELFLPEIVKGYQLYRFRQPSKKMPEVRLRRICLRERDADGSLQVYTIMPSYVLPYMMGDTNDVEKALFLRRLGVPFWALT